MHPVMTEIVVTVTFFVLVPFEIHHSSGILNVETGSLKEWKATYNLEVVAKDNTQEISASVIIHVTQDREDDANIKQLTDKLKNLPETLEFSVMENVDGEFNLCGIKYNYYIHGCVRLCSALP